MPSETHFLGQVTQKALIEKSGKYLFVQSPAHTKAAGLWDIPGGRLSEGEMPLDGLHREVFEEIGAQVKIGNIVGTTVFTNLSNSRCFLVLYEATLESAEEDFVLQEDEVSQAAWFSPKEIFNLPIIYPEYVTVLKKYFSV